LWFPFWGVCVFWGLGVSGLGTVPVLATWRVTRVLGCDLRYREGCFCDSAGHVEHDGAARAGGAGFVALV